jgi:hypothetical protein
MRQKKSAHELKEMRPVSPLPQVAWWLITEMRLRKRLAGPTPSCGHHSIYGTSN